MNEKTDSQLLRQYAEHRDEAAFAELVRRHVDFVHSAAQRMARSSQLAEEVTQSVFLALAKNAAHLTNRPLLAGWLHRTARNIAAQTVRTEVRRHAREQEAAAMNDLHTPGPEGHWDEIAPQLDAALDDLSEADRDALLLRYFQKHSAREIAHALGTSEEAAQKRVNRAAERLREAFARRGVTIGATALTAAITTKAIQAAPIGLGATISTAAALSGATVASSTLTQAIAMTVLQKTLIATTLLAAVGVGYYEANQVAQYRAQVEALQLAHAPLAGQLDQLQRERADLERKLALAREENERMNRNALDLARLRGEVARLNGESRELAQFKSTVAIAPGGDPAIEATLRSWASRANALKQRLEQSPDKKIPELQLLSEKEWLDAVKNTAKLETDEDFRRALANLRSGAKQEFGNRVRKAMKDYVEAHEGQLPDDLSQLKPYLDGTVDDAMLRRYGMTQTGKLGETQRGQFLFAETAPPVDEDHDLFYQFNLTGTRSTSANRADSLLQEAAIAFANANNDQLPRDPSHLNAYLPRPIDPAKMQEFLRRIPPGVMTLNQLKATGTLGR